MTSMTDVLTKGDFQAVGVSRFCHVQVRPPLPSSPLSPQASSGCHVCPILDRGRDPIHHTSAPRAELSPAVVSFVASGIFLRALRLLLASHWDPLLEVLVPPTLPFPQTISEPATETMGWRSILEWTERCGSPSGSAQLWGWCRDLESTGTTTSATRGICSFCASSSTHGSGCTARGKGASNSLSLSWRSRARRSGRVSIASFS
jgi:hypothetical protein